MYYAYVSHIIYTQHDHTRNTYNYTALSVVQWVVICCSSNIQNVAVIHNCTNKNVAV